MDDGPLLQQNAIVVVEKIQDIVNKMNFERMKMVSNH